MRQQISKLVRIVQDERRRAKASGCNRLFTHSVPSRSATQDPLRNPTHTTQSWRAARKQLDKQWVAEIGARRMSGAISALSRSVLLPCATLPPSLLFNPLRSPLPPSTPPHCCNISPQLPFLSRNCRYPFLRRRRPSRPCCGPRLLLPSLPRPD